MAKLQCALRQFQRQHSSSLRRVRPQSRCSAIKSRINPISAAVMLRP